MHAGAAFSSVPANLYVWAKICTTVVLSGLDASCLGSGLQLDFPLSMCRELRPL